MSARSPLQAREAVCVTRKVSVSGFPFDPVFAIVGRF